MSRIIFVNRFYWPETPATGQLLTDVATALALNGHRVAVVTSGHAGAALPRFETHERVDIHRVAHSRRADAMAGKAFAFGAFSLAATWWLLRHTQRGDVIVTLTDPPLLGVASAVVARVRGANLVHWVQDIYPEIAIAVSGHRWLRILSPFRNRAWQSAAYCVTLSDAMAAILCANGVSPNRVVVVPNWSPAGLIAVPVNDPRVTALRGRWNLDGKFVVAYSGNMGRVHDLEPIIYAAAGLRDAPKIAFVFVGHGAQRARLQAEANRLGLANVRFLPPQPRDELAVTLAAADVHLVTLRPGCESFVFPSKVYGVAAVGRPVLFVGPPDCGLAQIVRKHQIGRTVDSHHIDELITVIRELAENPALVAELGSAATRFAGPPQTTAALVRWQTILETLKAC